MGHNSTTINNNTNDSSTKISGDYRVSNDNHAITSGAVSGHNFAGMSGSVNITDGGLVKSSLDTLSNSFNKLTDSSRETFNQGADLLKSVENKNADLLSMLVKNNSSQNENVIRANADAVKLALGAGEQSNANFMKMGRDSLDIVKQISMQSQQQAKDVVGMAKEMAGRSQLGAAADLPGVSKQIIIVSAALAGILMIGFMAK